MILCGPCGQDVEGPGCEHVPWARLENDPREGEEMGTKQNPDRFRVTAVDNGKGRLKWAVTDDEQGDARVHPGTDLDTAHRHADRLNHERRWATR